jgi:hypothetical protein
MKRVLFCASAAMALALATAASADTRGPDSFGYVATDQVTYTFNDITATGTQVLNGVDDAVVQVSLGMDFGFYGQTYDTAYLSSNGVIMFGSGNNAWTNQDLTASQFSGGPAIFTYWDDLLTRDDASRGVYYETIGTTPGSRKFVVQQIANSYSIGGSSINFQTVLDEATGDVLMRYTQTTFGNASFDHGANATVGIQGLQSQGQVVQWSYNQGVLQDNQSICFTTNGSAACNAIVDSPAGVPEPATWALMILGFGGAGAILRRARSVPAVAA